MYPEMLSEVLEAVESHFDKYPEVKIDCMLYLYNALGQVSDTMRMEKWFEDNGICECCGQPLMIATFQEPHTELDFGVCETLYEKYCPVCDKGEDNE